eukprot:TRINITY_DN6110_c0_g1_i1.p1 TRINITY_DN6110_c0_g1~~TRINITY_DN6110_c0_g1_i1.p1  ORF type:complete len:383 (-),score=64.52 TRINITY_DN6110_c0_g1_i1:470-1618(-)
MKSSGAYSASTGIPYIREEVSNFIKKRDKIDDPAYTSSNNIYLSDGASPSIQNILNLLIREPSDGICIPIPQYPLYTATISLLGGSPVPYYLNEETNWGFDMNELSRSLKDSRSRGVNPRAIVIINPGNPTGSLLNLENMKQVIDFCYSEGLVLLADEVYQENVYCKETKPWHSFKKVLWEMGPKYSESLELVSFHSISKGFVGECGKRGGYCELTNIDPSVSEQLYKISSIGLCPNLIGQTLVGLMVNPPEPGSPSYPQYTLESTSIYQSLKRRSTMVKKSLETLPGIYLNEIEGAMYAFPRVEFTPAFKALAEKSGKPLDVFYCLSMLEETGVCVVPGSGFGQKDGTWHFRMTFLPDESDLERVLGKIGEFHGRIMGGNV